MPWMPSQGLSLSNVLSRTVAAHRKAFCRVWVAVCLSGACGLQAAEVWPAWVSWVMDGDTVLLVRQGQPEPVKLRIDGIDAPETCQPGGMASRDAMIRLTLRKSVLVTDLGLDHYGRQVGRLSVDGQDVGGEMVRTGMAWAYRFRTGRGPYAVLQRSAEKQKKGLFSAAEAAMSPSVFRRFHGACQGIAGP